MTLRCVHRLRRIVVTGEPGLAGRQFALADPDSPLDRDGVGGLYIGADPLCDIVLADPAAEAWHARLVGQGEHFDLEVIAGRVTIDGLEHLPDDRRRLGTTPFSIGRVALSHDEQPRPDLPSALAAEHRPEDPRR